MQGLAPVSRFLARAGSPCHAQADRPAAQGNVPLCHRQSAALFDTDCFIMVVRIPPGESVLHMSDEAPEDDPYELAPVAPRLNVPPLPQDQPGHIAAAPQPASRVLAYRSALVPGSNSGRSALDVEKFIRQTVPLWLLTGGLLIEGLVTFLRFPKNPNAAIVHLLLNVGIGTVLMMAGVVIAARVRQIDIGSIATALLRLAALIVAVAAVSDILAPIAFIVPFGGLALLVLNFVLYFALLGTFFDLDQSDTWYCLCVIVLINLGVYFSVRFLL